MLRLVLDCEVNVIYLVVFFGWLLVVLWIFEIVDVFFDINIFDLVFRMLLLIVVVEENWDVVDVIFSYGGFINFFDKVGYNILWYVVKSNKVDIIKCLIIINFIFVFDFVFVFVFYF